jgi:hypothetical protein
MNVSASVYLDRDADPRPPRPLPVTAVYLVLALGALGVGYGAGLVWPELLIAPVSLALAGAVQGGRRTLDLIRRRRAADQWLRTGGAAIPVHRWRAERLVSPRERRVLVRSLEEVLRDLSGRLMPGAVPLNRAGLRPHGGEIEALAERLGDLSRPVSPRGILLVHDLLTLPGSPLYSVDAEGAEELPGTVARILVALDGDLPRRTSVRRVDH